MLLLPAAAVRTLARNDLIQLLGDPISRFVNLQSLHLHGPMHLVPHPLLLTVAQRCTHLELPRRCAAYVHANLVRLEIPFSDLQRVVTHKVEEPCGQRALPLDASDGSHNAGMNLQRACL